MAAPPEHEQPQLTIGVGIDAGLARQHKPNQDSVGMYSDYCDDVAWLEAKGRLFVVADGMGGAAGGKEASALAVETVLDSFYDNPELPIKPCLERALQEANDQIKRQGETNDSLRGLGTTVVAAVIRARELVVANLGDSRAYLLHNGVLQQLSVDHTVIQDQMRAGLLSPAEAAVHPRRHVLSRNLGSRSHVQPHIAAATLADGDALILCSDGLWGPVDDGELSELVQHLHAQDAADALVARANGHGGPDNISAIVIQVGAFALGSPLAAEDPQPPAPRRRAGGAAAWAAVGVTLALLLASLYFLRGALFATTSKMAAAPAGLEVVASIAPTALPQAAAPPPLPQTATQAARPTTAAQMPAPTSATEAAGSARFMRLAHDGDVRSVAFRADGQTFVSAALDGSVKLWQASDGALLAAFTTSELPAESIAFDDAGQLLAAGFSDGSIKLWRVSDVPGMAAEATALSFDPSQTPTAQGQSRAARSTPVATFVGHSTAITGLAFTSNGQMLASASRDGSVNLWRLRDTRTAIRLPAAPAAVVSLAFAPNGASLAAALANGSVKFWSVGATPITTSELVGNQALATHIAFSPDSQTLAVASNDHTLVLWRLSDNNASVLRTLHDPQATLERVTFAPDGKLIATTSTDNSVRLWQTSTGALVQTFTSPAASSIAFAPGGLRLAVGSSSGGILLWRVQ